MEKSQSIKLFLLLQAVFFAAAWPLNTGLPLVLVAEVNNSLQPLTILEKELSGSGGLHLAYVDSYGAPIRFIKQKDNSLLSTNLKENGYVSLKDNVLKITQNKQEKLIFDFNDEGVALNFTCYSCTRLLSYDVFLEQEDENEEMGPKAIFHLLPFDQETRSVEMPVKGISTQVSTSLSIPAGPRMTLFVRFKNMWHPITHDSVFREMYEKYLTIYPPSLRYPIDITPEGGLVTNVFNGVSSYLCWDLYALVLKPDCQERMTLNENKVLNETVFFCEGLGRILRSFKPRGVVCESVEIRLFYHDKETNAPLLSKPI